MIDDRKILGLALLAGILVGRVPSLPLHSRRSDARALRITPWSSRRTASAAMDLQHKHKGKRFFN